jgi:hypothetical protein
MSYLKDLDQLQIWCYPRVQKKRLSGNNRTPSYHTFILTDYGLKENPKMNKSNPTVIPDSRENSQ